MLSVEWEDNSGKHLSCYWMEKVEKSYLLQECSRYDYVEFWYPRHIEKQIYDDWGELFQYIHYNQKWGDQSTTLISNLEKKEDELLKDFTKNTRYEVNRASKRDQLCIVFNTEISETELTEFISYYNCFAETKKLGTLNEAKTLGLAKGHCFMISKVLNKRGDILAVHSYIYKEGERTELYTSSSLFRELQSEDERNLVGRANRYLHYQDFLFFKRMGIPIYDWGGAYLKEDNIELKKITEFKRKFGGTVESSDVSIVLPLKKIMMIESKLAELVKRLKIEKKNVIFFGYNNFGKYCVLYLEREGIYINTIIDNYSSGERDGRCIEKDHVLDKYDPSSTMLLVCLRETTFESLKERFYRSGFLESDNLFNCW